MPGYHGSRGMRARGRDVIGDVVEYDARCWGLDVAQPVEKFAVCDACKKAQLQRETEEQGGTWTSL